MLKFSIINVLFGCLLVLCIALYKLYGISGYVFLILLFAYSLLLFYGCYYIGSNFFIRVICSAKTNDKVIALSFDDGPNATNTANILALLKETGVQAAFFCIGKNIENNKTIVKQAFAEGHLIGNHSFGHHFWFDMLPAKKMLEDLQTANKAISDVIGKQPILFRPPYGVTNPNLAKAIIKGNFTPVGWSVRSMDTVIKDQNVLLEKITKKVKPGAVFLFHDTCKTTLAILPAFINYARHNGYQIIRLDKMLKLQGYA